MNYRGHIVGGIASYLITLYVLSFYNLQANNASLLFWFMTSIFGALFPDIDIKSKGQKIFYLLLSLIIVWSVAAKNLVTLSIASLFGMAPLISRHRGMFHSIWLIVFTPIAITLTLKHFNIVPVTFYPCLFFITGALSHLILDSKFRN